MVFFYTNITLLTRVLSWSTLRTIATCDEVLRQVCATFGIETFEEERQKAIDMFFEDNDVSALLLTGYGKSPIYQAAPEIDRLSSPEETVHNICRTAR